MLAFDAIGAMATGHADISEVMFAQVLIITAIIITATQTMAQTEIRVQEHRLSANRQK